MPDVRTLRRAIMSNRVLVADSIPPRGERAELIATLDGDMLEQLRQRVLTRMNTIAEIVSAVTASAEYMDLTDFAGHIEEEQRRREKSFSYDSERGKEYPRFGGTKHRPIHLK
jgi:hypothetical protein